MKCGLVLDRNAKIELLDPKPRAKTRDKGSRFYDRTNEQLGDRRVLGLVGWKGVYSLWLLQCVCGERLVVRSNSMNNNRHHKCNCQRIRYSKHPLYSTWRKVICNCHVLNTPLSEDWQVFEKFLQDVKQAKEDFCITRKNTSQPLGPDNWIWMKLKDIQRRTSLESAKKLTFNGQTKTIHEWADHLGITHQALYFRLQKYPLELALTVKKVLRGKTYKGLVG